MDKEKLKQIRYLKKEIETLSVQIEDLKCITVADKVKGSSSQFPYTTRSFTIEGVDTERIMKLQRKLNRKIDRLMDTVEEIYSFIDSIDDSLTRQIISLRYVNGLQWNQVADKIGGGNTSESVRKVAERFLKEEVEK